MIPQNVASTCSSVEVVSPHKLHALIREMDGHALLHGCYAHGSLLSIIPA